MTSSPNFRTTVRQLGLAMLNATLMLAIILVFLVLLLLGRLQGFAQDTRAALHDALTPQAARLETIASGVESIELCLSDRDSAALKAEVVALRNDIAEVRTGLQGLRQIGPGVLAERALKAIGGRLTSGDPPAPG